MECLRKAAAWLGAKLPWRKSDTAEPPYVSPFSADSAITREDQDLLGRTKFAGELARLLSGWKAEHSLVVALRGGWGEGKSSLKNLILRALEKGDKKAKVVEFNPWRYGDSNSISAAFYGEIGTALGDMPGNEAKRRKHAFLKYSRLLSPVSTGTKKAGEGLGAAVGWVANLGLLTLGAGAFITGLPIVKIAGGIIGLASLLGLFGKVLEWLSGKDRPEKPLDLVRDDLMRRLKKMPTPILVIIDDIDRLEPEEVRTVFRHVKANADFPGLTYLLLFQRDIVEKALSDISGGQGRDYLEKIVQAAFDLPTVEQSRISNAFLAALEKVLTGYVNAQNGFDQVRFGNVFQGGVRHYLSNLRDVHRFLAALTVHLELHRGSRVLEVNVVDFVAIEALRLFEPDVFAAIARNKALFTTTRRALGLYSGAVGDAERLRIRAIIDLADEPEREVVEELVNRLFPPIRWALGGSEYGSDFIPGWSAERRVCAASHFDRYFHLRLEDDTISDSEIIEILDAAQGEETLRLAISGVRERGLLNALFRRFDDLRNKLPLEHIAVLLPAMFEAAELLDPNLSSGFDAPYVSAWRSALWYLRQESDLERRGQIFLAALRKANALSVPGELISLDMEKREKQRSEDLTILTDAQLAEAQSLWINKFKERQLSLNPLLKDPSFRRNLFRWKRFGGASEVDGFVLSIARKPDLFIPLLRAFRWMSMSQSSEDRVASTNWTLGVDALTAFIDYDELVSLASQADRASLTDEDQALLDEMLNAQRPVKTTEEILSDGDDD